ncbi:GNAT family N-acetyltransferase [Pseudomonas syringae]|nr:acetyltransferase [Pseudomonas syringae]
MNNLLFSLVLSDGSHAKVIEAAEGAGQLVVTGYPPVSYRAQGDTITLESLPAVVTPLALLALLGSRFCRRRRCTHLVLVIATDRAFAVMAVRLGVADRYSAQSHDHMALHCKRRTFWQHPLPWLTAPSSGHTAPDYGFSAQQRHPRRPPLPHSEVYRRYLPGLDTTFTLRTLDPDKDLETFHRWMNLEQVAFFWEQAGSLEEQAAYLQTLFQDPRVHPLIGCFDDEPFAYFEVYWCKEDRIAPYYDVHDYDRGWHVVIGESKHQGIGKLRAWFGSLMHYMFLDDPRTQRIMGEPRIDHTRQIDFLKSQGYGHLKNIQLPHKKAALLRLEREHFFDEHAF